MPSEIDRITRLPGVDAEYRFGIPKTYLAAHELARLTILRSKLGETRQEREAEHLGTPKMGDVRDASTCCAH